MKITRIHLTFLFFLLAFGTGKTYSSQQHRSAPLDFDGDIGLRQQVDRVPGDYDGDGKLDFCIHSRATKKFNLIRSSDRESESISLGLSTDRAVPGDFHLDGKSDFCVVREAASQWEWFILERDGGGTGSSPIRWGNLSPPTIDRCCGTGDYDGDSKTEMAVLNYTFPNYSYYIRRTSTPIPLSIPIDMNGGGLPLFPW